MQYGKPIALIAQLIATGLCLFGCNRQSASPSAATSEQARNDSGAELPEWSLVKSDSTSLGAPFRMSQFEIRPPANFRFVKHIAELNTYYWVGPVRKDETYPQFMIIVTCLPTDKAKTPLADLLQEVMGSIKKRRQDWSDTAAEQGKINGLRFIRSSWRGVATNAAHEGLSGREMHGIVYLAVHDNQAIQIMCQDVVPDHAESLKQGKSAVMTFRVAPPQTKSP